MDAKELLARWARNFTSRLALRQVIELIAQELGKIDLADIRVFVGSNRSLVETYISALSPEVKSQINRQAENLQRAGVSVGAMLDVVLPEVERKLPQHVRVLKENAAWYQQELQRIKDFLA